MSIDLSRAHYVRAVATVVVLSAAPASAASFKYTDLSDAAYVFTAALALNDHDQVAGFVQNADGTTIGMAWSSGVFAEVPETVSFVAVDTAGLAAGENAVNGKHAKTYVTYNVNNGQVGSNPVNGEALTFLEGGNARGEIFANTEKTTRGGSAIGVLVNGTTSTNISYPGSVATNLYAINNSGELVGLYFPPSQSTGTFFTYKSGTYTPFDYPANSGAYAPSVGTDGTIGGSYRNDSGLIVGFLLHNSIYTTVSFPGATATYVNAVGPGDEAVGQFNDGSTNHGFIYRNGKYHQIDYPGSSATVIDHVNARGSLLGAYTIPPGTGYPHSFIAQCSSGNKCTQ